MKEDKDGMEAGQNKCGWCEACQITIQETKELFTYKRMRRENVILIKLQKRRGMKKQIIWFYKVIEDTLLFVMVIIAPSILSADFTKLGEEIRAVGNAGAEWIHVDVMDGHFVPNITIGPVVVKSIRKKTGLFIDCHLMIENPEKYVHAFASAGANLITIHQESVPQPLSIIDQIHQSGCKAGISINPETSIEAIRLIIPKVDLVLIMSVHPGFSGQKFIADVLPKLKEAHTIIAQSKKQIYLQVDGGINPENAKLVKQHGADVLVAASFIFQSKDYKKAIEQLKNG